MVSILVVNVKYKGIDITSEINLKEHCPFLEKYTEEFIAEVVEAEVYTITLKKFISAYDFDLEKETVTFSLMFEDNQFLQDEEELPISKFVNLSRYKYLSEQDKYEELYSELLEPLQDWIESKFKISYQLY